jgi:hypothetical protein
MSSMLALFETADWTLVTIVLLKLVFVLRG